MTDSNDNVIILDVATKLDIPPDRVLEGAKGELERCIVIGRKEDNSLYFASSITDAGKILWLLEKAKTALLNH